MSISTRSDAVAVIDSTFDDVFALIDRWRQALEAHFQTGAVDVAAIDALVEQLVVPDLSREGALIIGAGFVAQPGFIPDAPWHLAWWLGHQNTFGVTGPAAPELRRLLAVEDEHSESFRDYTTLEWWRVPATTHERHITGPYVDYLCTDDYTLTSTMPAFGFCSAHAMPAITALVTCRPVAFWNGASARVSWIDSREPYQSALRSWP